MELGGAARRQLGDDVDAFTRVLLPDDAGRLAVRLQPGPWVVFARNTTSCGWARIDAREPQALEVALTPMRTMRGRVVDEKGAPIAGAWARVQSSTMERNRAEPPLGAITDLYGQSWLDTTRPVRMARS